MKNTMLGILGGLMVLVPGTARSDEMDRFAVELVPGASFATEELADADLGTGLGADLTVGVRFLPHLWAYGGWGWRRFSADMSFAGPNIDAEETGYSLGVRFEHPFNGPATPAFMLRAGATYTHIEIENAGGATMMDSGHGLGWEAATGVAFRMRDHWRLTPGVRFRSLKRDFDLDTTTTPATLRYISAEVGLSRTF